jgi:hypothetical protein
LFYFASKLFYSLINIIISWFLDLNTRIKIVSIDDGDIFGGHPDLFGCILSETLSMLYSAALPGGGHGVVGLADQGVLLPPTRLSHRDHLERVGPRTDVPRDEANLLRDAALQVKVTHGILIGQIK